MARCEVYEIQGPDPGRTAGAVRCHREAKREAAVDGKKYPTCDRHCESRWELFVKDRWRYAVDLTAAKPKKKRHN